MLKQEKYLPVSQINKLQFKQYYFYDPLEDIFYRFKQNSLNFDIFPENNT